MLLFKLFGLTETITYIVLGALSIIVILFIVSFVLISKKESKKRKENQINEKLIADKVNEAKIAQLKIKDTQTVSKDDVVVEEKPKVTVEQKLESKPKAFVEETEVVKEEKTEINTVVEQVEVIVEEEKIEVNAQVEDKKDDTKVNQSENTNDDSSKEKAGSKYKGKYEIVREADFFRYRLKASNGEVIVLSEPYTTEKGARNGVETLKRDSVDGKVDIVEDKHGLFHFRLITKNNRVLAQSANYETESRAVSASKSFEKFVMTDVVVLDEEAKASHFAAEKIDVEVSPDSSGKFIIEKVEDGYQYVLKASNGRKICVSKTYKTIMTCKNSIEAFREIAYNGDFYVSKDKNNNYQFKLYNNTNRLIMTGEVYSTKKACLNAIESIKRFAKFAALVE